MKNSKDLRFIRLPNKDGVFNRFAKTCKFRDTDRIFFFEVGFKLDEGKDRIVRCDSLYEYEEIFGMKGSGFLPSDAKDFREGCRKLFKKFREEEVFLNRFAVELGMREPEYSDLEITSMKYHL